MEIKFENVSAGYEEDVIRCLTFYVEKGQTVAIVGVSGIGKSTVLRCAAGLMEPTDGSVLINKEKPQYYYGKGRLAYLPQKIFLWKHKTVAENLDLYLKLNGYKEDEQAKHAALEMVGLMNDSEKYPHELSGGMKARLAIARTFLYPPEVLLMDEPFSAIDQLRRSYLNRELQSLARKSQCTVVWVTHDIVEAMKFSAKILAIAKNKKARLFNLESLPEIKDPAWLCEKNLSIRDEIIEFIEASYV